MGKDENTSIDFLWQSFMNGDDKSFAMIYQKHIDPLLSYGNKLSSDKEVVHDALQEVFIDLYLKREKQGVKIGNLKSYLFVALRHNLIKKNTQNKKYSMQKLETIQEDSPFCIEYGFQEEIINLEISEEIKSELAKAVNGLPAKQKEIIYLKFQEELEYKEIADILSISVESARKSIYRALFSLRKIVSAETFKLVLFTFFKKSSFSLSMF